MVRSPPHVQLTPRAPLPPGTRPPHPPEAAGDRAKEEQCRFTRNVTVIAKATGAATKNRAEAGHHRCDHRLTAVRPVAIRRGSRRVIIPHIAGFRRVAARRAAAYAEPTQPAIAPAGRAARWRTGQP